MPDRDRHVGVRPDQVEEVGNAGRGLADRGVLRSDTGQRSVEHDKSSASWKRRRGCEDAVVPRRFRRDGDVLCGRVVVAYEIRVFDSEVRLNLLVGQVEHFEPDRDAPGAAPDLERIDAVVDEVAEELGPRGLFLVRRVPHAGFASTVVATTGHGGMRTGEEVTPYWTLVPERPRDGATRRGCDVVGGAHT